MKIELKSKHRRASPRREAGGLAFAVLAVFSASAWSQVPEAFRPNAGTILNIFAPPVEMPELPSVSLPKIADEISGDDAAGAKFKVTRFILEGVTLLPQAEIEAQLAGLVGQEVSLGDLRKAAAASPGSTGTKGYFLARAYVPAQDIGDGVVRMAVLEGHYDRRRNQGLASARAAARPGRPGCASAAEGQPIERSSSSAA